MTFAVRISRDSTPHKPVSRSAGARGTAPLMCPPELGRTHRSPSRIHRLVCLIPPHYDFLCATLIDGFHQLDVRLTSSAQSNNSSDEEYVPLDAIAPHCDEADAVLLFSNTAYSTRKEFVRRHGLAHKTVHIDGSDRGWPDDWLALRTYPLCFKRECPTGATDHKLLAAPRSLPERFWRTYGYRVLGQRLMPLPFAAERTYFKYSGAQLERDINVSCTLVPKECNPRRQKINEFVDGLGIPRSLVGRISSGDYRTSAASSSKDEYFRMLARSKISISHPGLGFDTGRFWEILASRSLLFSPSVQIKMPHPFVEHTHFVPYSTLEELGERLTYFLSHDEERTKIAQRGYEHLVMHHTSEQRARYLLEIVATSRGA